MLRSPDLRGYPLNSDATARCSCLLVLWLFTGTISGAAAAETGRSFDIGTPGDEAILGTGIYQREGPNAKSKHSFYRTNSFRWFGNLWTLKLPVTPHRHNEVILRAKLHRSLRLRVGDRYEIILSGMGDSGYEYSVILSADVVGANSIVELQGETVPPVPPSANSRDKRELALAVDWVRIRVLDQLPAGGLALQQLPTAKEPDLPLPFRLRGTEARPLYTDIESYVLQARQMRCNVMTIGPMNGQHYTAFSTTKGTPYRDMHPEFIPRQISALHEHGIAAIGWLPFNVQDLRKPEDCQAARQHPEWRMEFIDWRLCVQVLSGSLP